MNYDLMYLEIIEDDLAIERGANALRSLEQGDKKLNAWETLPNSVKKKWIRKAKCVIAATLQEPVS